MRHPPIEQLRAFAADEASPRWRRRTAAHLTGCPTCRMRVAWVRDIRVAAAEATAIPAPEGAWGRIAARVAAGAVVILPEAGMPARRLWTRRPALRAALLILGVAGAASAAVPGSPVRAWIGRVLPQAWVAGPGSEGAAAEGPDAADSVGSGAATDALPPTTLLVPLTDGALAIRVERAHPDLRIRVRVGEESDVMVHASGAAAGGRFRTGTGRLTIEEAGEGEIVVGLPAATGRVTLEVDGRLFFIKEAGQLQIMVPVTDSVGSEFVFSTGGAAARLR